MSPLRARMIEDMTLAGLAEGTQKIYIQSVRRLAAHYHRSPDELSEEEVRGYLLGLPPLCSNLHRQYICGGEHVIYYPGL
jgi:hypothetical protein